MSPRDTKTGKVLEAMIVPSLANGGYAYQTQVNVGRRPGGRRHMVDVLATKDGQAILVSLKWQQVGGTAEQKVPFEVISLTQAVLDSNGKYQKAYLVLGGGGWTLREFYTSGGLKKYLEYADKVEIQSLEQFVAFANQGRL
jgi:hypothetical protein